MMDTDQLDPSVLWIGRVERQGIGPCVVTLREGEVLDITSKEAPTVRDVMELDDAAAFVRAASGERLDPSDDSFGWLAPCDLQSVKACGVTFARSMVERVIEEQAAGDPARAEAIRARIGARIGESLSSVVPGSETAKEVKAALIEEGLWSQYLEVGIGPDAEVFWTQVLSSVGAGADVGLHPISTWNNPAPRSCSSCPHGARSRARPSATT